MEEEKNNDKSSMQLTQLEEGFFVLRFRNDSADVIRERKEISSRFIQFHYCMIY